MASRQFNARIDEAIKERGDLAFASVNYTPTQVVHAVWGYAARNRNNKKALKQLTDLLSESTDATDALPLSTSWVQDGPQTYLSMLDEMGVSLEADPISLSDEELLFQAHREKMTERGTDA